ncbi:MAG: DUF2330 domain-containing protein [Planctomycetota bacterium]|nr:DUF2330 domain-containing protein [Planctomycetota bacterium]MDP7131354.1 DUF2330 domain-containing protein [Planctomycetota bacterium]MDP7250101.1 DUF2330 domain-containing protein [Planctomycetota bacterium]
MPEKISSHIPLFCLLMFAFPAYMAADGILRPYKERDYTGSVEEKSQEAIIIFKGGDEKKRATEDIILKVTAAGDAKSFSWIIPFPKQPEISKEDPKLFKEVFSHIEARKRELSYKPKSKSALGSAEKEARPQEAVVVLARKTVGSFETVVVAEKQAGALNGWLEKEGYLPLEGAEDVLGFYRKKGYVYACIKVSDVELTKDKPVDLHPLRFSFETGGRDGIYFPMKMSGLQTGPFDVNLNIFYRYWINDGLSKYGYVHRGFTRRYRDWDSPKCVPNGGKAYSAPQTDPFLRSAAGRIPTLAKFFQKRHPGQRFYLTNIQLRGAKPADVRDWSDDLWLFPYYTDRSFVPYDARPGGVAAAAWD